MHKNKQREAGVSLITLVITIIVAIILAAIALGGGAADTPGQAQYSGFALDIANVQEAMEVAVLSSKREEAVRGIYRTDAQLYNYVARGGAEVVDADNKWLTMADAESIPCTKIKEETAEKVLGMKLPKIKVETIKSKSEYVSFFVTPKGVVFCWPPYVYDGQSYVTNDVTVKNGTEEYAKTEATEANDVMAQFKTGEKVKISNSEAVITFEKGHVDSDEDIGVSYVAKGSPVGIDLTNYRNDGSVVEGGGAEPTPEITPEPTPEVTENSVVVKLKVGDYVSYTPDGAGADTSVAWRVWSVKGDSVLITPANAVGSLTLDGVADYMDIVNNAASKTDKINRACKAYYTNSRLGITGANIRSMTVEDINEACGHTPTSIVARYAYYPYGTSVSGTIDYNGNTYAKTAHRNDYENGYTEPRFYIYDGGGVEATDSNGNTYRKPEADNPVYVTQTYDRYYPSNYNHVENSSVTAGSILGDVSYGWLASACVNLNSPGAGFYVYNACSRGVNADELACSDGHANSYSNGLRPLVSLSSELQAIGGNGSSAPTAWRLSK